MTLWMQVDFRTALPEQGTNLFELKNFRLKFKIRNAEELRDTRNQTWAARVQEVLHQWEHCTVAWPVRILALELVEKEEEND